MSGRLSWRYLLPRLLLVVALLTAIQYGLGVAVRSIAVRSVADAVGGSVDLDHANVSLLNRQVVLSDLRVTSANQPQQNLLEADRCELNFETGPLLHKRAVVSSGEITGVRFAAARTADVSSNNAAAKATAPAAPWFRDQSAELANGWLTQLEQQFQPNRFEQLPSVQLTDNLMARWTNQRTALSQRVSDLQQRAADLVQQVRVAQSNPLRHDDFLDGLSEKITALNKEFDQLTSDVQALPTSIEADRRAIVAARRDDVTCLHEKLQPRTVTADALTAYFLCEQAASSLDEVIGWLRWTRKMVPANADAQPRDLVHLGHTRGEDVLFAGCHRAPGWLIRTLDLQGTARIGGQPLEWRGTLSDASADPTADNQPMRLRIATTGSLPLVLQATLDRTGPSARDELIVDCRGIVVPPMQLGQSDRLRLSLNPSVGTLNASIILEGDKLSGDIQLVQKQVEITPGVAGNLGRTQLANALGDALGDLHSFATRLALQGTLNEPQCTLWSNLGPAMAEATDRALGRAGDQLSRETLTAAQRRVDERLTQLDRQISETQADLLPQLTRVTSGLQEIAGQQSTPQRLNVEHLGRKLPANSLFR